MFTFIFQSWTEPKRIRRIRERFLLPDEWRQVRTILATCPIKVRVFFTLLLLLGCRRGELLRMEWAHLDLEFGIWHKPRTKNGKSHTMGLPRTVCHLLGQIPKTGRFVFTGDLDHTGTKPDQPWSGTAATFWWKKIRKAAGVPDVWIHDLRRTLGAWMAMHGENLRIIQAVLNHSDIRTTAKVYTPLQVETQRQALTRHAERVLAALPALILALALSGCISTDHLYLGQDRFPPQQALIEFLADPPARPFLKLAIVEAVGRSSHTDWEELREALAQEAAAIGADAVMDLSMGGNLVGAVGGGRGVIAGGVSERKKLTGVAIRWVTALPPNP